MITDDDIRSVFLAAGFTIKPGNDDLKPYVFEAGRKLAALAVAQERERCAVAAWNHYMDICKRRGLPAAMCDEWCAAGAIRQQPPETGKAT